jgi:hypothetical protein
MVETSEREMVRKTEEIADKGSFTSLQPTYEDSIPPDPENDWDDEE